jgi:two-component system alkaline phosphatase synthesis response regulator PhoP
MTKPTPKRVLILDDELYMLQLVAFTIRKIGVEVFTASNLTEFQRITEDNPIDLLIMDYMIPCVDILETIKSMREQKPYESTPIMMITARGEALEGALQKKLGIGSYINKPFSPTFLCKEVQRLLTYNQETAEALT